jgi:hypothetical protein
MTLIEQIMEQFKTLSPAQQAEVLNFVNFLVWKEERRKKQITELHETLADIEDPARIRNDERKK